jgi:hypothetical protein
VLPSGLSCSVVISAILRGPASLGFLSSSKDGKKRRVKKAPSTRIRKMNCCCIGIRFRNNAIHFITRLCI